MGKNMKITSDIRMRFFLSRVRGMNKLTIPAISMEIR
jgi:hypothetical protein